MVTLKEMKRNKNKFFKIFTFTTEGLPVTLGLHLVLFPSAWRICFEFFQPQFISNVFVSHFRIFFATYKLQDLQVWFFFFQYFKRCYSLSSDICCFLVRNKKLFVFSSLCNVLPLSFLCWSLQLSAFHCDELKCGLCIWPDWGEILWI